MAMPFYTTGPTRIYINGLGLGMFSGGDDGYINESFLNDGKQTVSIKTKRFITELPVSEAERGLLLELLTWEEWTSKHLAARNAYHDLLIQQGRSKTAVHLRNGYIPFVD